MTEEDAKKKLLLRGDEAAALLGLGRSTFWRYVQRGDLPPPVYLGAVTRWRRDEIEAAVERLTSARNRAA